MATKIKITRSDKFLTQKLYLALLDDFINDSFAGRRTRKNGARISKATVVSYEYLKKQLVDYSEKPSAQELKIYIVNHLTQGQKEQAGKYYKKFYTSFCNFLYDDKKYFDNYVGLIIKTMRSFFNYVEQERNISVGTFHKSFYVPKEEIPIVALSADQLNYIINDETFNVMVKKSKLEETKDVFVVGCTVALRISDLLQLSRKNLVVKGGNYYIQVRSQKTNTFTIIKLPNYAVAIIEKYKGKQKTLLPSMSANWFNVTLKRLGKLLPDNFELVKTRERRGRQVVVYKDPARRKHYQLSDHITAHTMRRTGITTMLTLGMPEHLVRKISGHADNSKEFFRYVQLTQSHLDEATDKVFERMQELN